MTKFLKVLGIIIGVILLALVCVYHFVLQYPNLSDNPKIDKWYKVESDKMKSSDGSTYHALFKKGNENKVLVYFAGGGVSVNEEMARNDTYNTTLVRPDVLANITMNMGGLAATSEANPLSDWTMILFPYATGDFHSGTGEFKYIDTDGKEKILYHNGYTNFTTAMEMIMERAGIDNPESVVVTGYSAGGFGAALLADDVFSNYFPNAMSKTVLVDSALLLNDDWHSIATDVWKSPKHISDRLVSNNITLDSLTSLHEKFADKVNILFDSSTRDGDLAKVQHYFDTGIDDIDENIADIYQQILRDTIPKFKEQAGAYIFIWDGFPWYDDPRNMTAHTIIATPYSFIKLSNTESSIADWLMKAVNGKLEDYGLDLVNKEY